MNDLPNTSFPYSSDCVATTDEFQRRGFAQRVVETVLSQPLGSCVVVSIVGSWGSGKSTVLKFIHDEVAARSSKEGTCRVAPFNPWRFAGEDVLLFQLFDSLVKAIDPKNEVLTEWQTLQDYFAKVSTPLGKLLALPANLLIPGIGEVVSAVTSSFKSEELKKRIDSIRSQAIKHLENQGMRVLVLLDDVDRLDADDLLMLLKAIKLIADLPNTTFVIAMDEEHVSQVIGHRIGATPDVGRRYIEKIVNVRLGLPTIPHHILEEYTLGLMDKTIQESHAFCPPADSARVRSVFTKLHSPFIRTPRTAKSIQNALSFALGLLGDEVNAGDVLLLEATRLLHPKLYQAIERTIPAIANRLEGYSIMLDDEDGEARGQRQQVWDLLMADFSNMGDQQKSNIKQALQNWFPQLYDDGGNDSLNSWDLQRRLCSKHYFWRYYTGAILKDDVRDEEVMSWIQQSQNGVDGSADKLKEHLNQPNAKAFLAKLKTFCSPNDNTSIGIILCALTKAASGLPNKGESNITGTIKIRAAELAGELVSIVPTADREAVVLKMLENSQDLGWSFVLWRNIDNSVLNTMTRRREDQPLEISKVDCEMAKNCLAAYEAGDLPDTNDMITNMVWAISRNFEQNQTRPRIEAMISAQPLIGLHFTIMGCGFSTSGSDDESRWIWYENKSFRCVKEALALPLLKEALSKVLVPQKDSVKYRFGDNYYTLQGIGWKCQEAIDRDTEEVPIEVPCA